MSLCPIHVETIDHGCAQCAAMVQEAWPDCFAITEGGTESAASTARPDAESEAKSEALIADILAFVRFEGSDHDISIRKAIDRFAYHCYGEGRDDERQDCREVLIQRAEQVPLKDRAPYVDMLLRFNQPAFERAARAMNESGQGEHMGLTK